MMLWAMAGEVSPAGIGVTFPPRGARRYGKCFALGADRAGWGITTPAVTTEDRRRRPINGRNIAELLCVGSLGDDLFEDDGGMIAAQAPSPACVGPTHLLSDPVYRDRPLRRPYSGGIVRTVSISFPSLDRRWRPHDAKRDATADRRVHGDDGRWLGGRPMPTNLDAAVDRYLRAKTLTRDSQRVLLDSPEVGAVGRRCPDRGATAQGHPRVPRLGVRAGGGGPRDESGRTVNKAREHLRAVLSWAWEQELIDARPGSRSPGRNGT
jgi:hypothetical protein